MGVCAESTVKAPKSAIFAKGPPEIMERILPQSRDAAIL
jgi:hypothetical protein